MGRPRPLANVLAARWMDLALGEVTSLDCQVYDAWGAFLGCRFHADKPCLRGSYCIGYTPLLNSQFPMEKLPARPAEDRQRDRTEGAKAACEGCRYLEGGEIARPSRTMAQIKPSRFCRSPSVTVDCFPARVVTITCSPGWRSVSHRTPPAVA